MATIRRTNARNAGTLTKKLKLPPTSLALCFRHIKPSWKHYIDYVALCAVEDKDQQMAKVINTYNALLPRERATVTPELLCELSKVSHKELFAAVCGKLFERSQQESALITAANLPRVVERTMQQAATKGGVRDREMVHKHSGFLPTPKGQPPVVINQRTAIMSAGETKIMTQLPSPEQDAMLVDDAVSLPLLTDGTVESTEDA